jgi:hypothetical protein
MQYYSNYADTLIYIKKHDGLGNEQSCTGSTLKCAVRENFIWCGIQPLLILDFATLKHSWYFVEESLTRDRGLILINEQICIVFYTKADDWSTVDTVFLASPWHDGTCLWARILINVLTELRLFGNGIKHYQFDARAIQCGKTHSDALYNQLWGLSNLFNTDCQVFNDYGRCTEFRLTTASRLASRLYLNVDCMTLKDMSAMFDYEMRCGTMYSPIPRSWSPDRYLCVCKVFHVVGPFWLNLDILTGPCTP